MLEQQKSNPNNSDNIIDQYLNNKNIIIVGSIVLILIFIITLVLASGNPTNQSSSKIEVIEQRIDALDSQQQAIQASLIDLLNTMRVMKKTLNIKTSNSSEYDSSIPEPEVFMNDSFQSKPKPVSYRQRLSRPATDIELKRSNISIIENKFDSETENKAWRDATEIKIMRILERKRFTQTRFDQLQCKRTICKLEITHNKKSRSDKFLKEFPVALYEFDEIITVEPQDNGNFMATLFLQQRK